MNKILCIGEALIDMICTDKGVALSDGQNFLKKPGGAPTNVAAAIAALGGSASIVAKVGADPFGQHLVDVMTTFKVNCEHIFRDKNSFTTFAFVSLMESGERDFYFNRGADGELTKAEVDAINLDEYGIIHFGSATGFLQGPLREAYLHLLEKALALKKFISFDPNYRSLLFADDQQSFIDQSWNFIHKCNFFKVSDEEALLITGANSVKEAATLFSEKTAATFAITLGKEGTMLSVNAMTQVIESIEVNVTDTTGAGDAFVGAVLFLLSEKTYSGINSSTAQDWQEIVAKANIAGARTCEYMGAMEAFKYLNKDIFN